MAIKAVLFDVGGPLNTEVEHERQVDAAIRAAFAAEGRPVTDDEYAAASDWAVGVYASDTYAAIAWRLSGGDVGLAGRLHQHFRSILSGSPRFDLRPGMKGLLGELREKGLLLGLAANQPASTLITLDQLGMSPFFSHRQVSGSHGFKKPDPRLFLAACEDLRVQPVDCVMVGDRIDNDIAPAKLLGMPAIRFRTGRHFSQSPRTLDEVPDAEVFSVDELRTALDELIGARQQPD